MNILLKNGPGRNCPAGSNVPGPATGAGGNLLPAAWARPLPGEEVTSPDHVYESSRRFAEAGLSVIPIEAYEGSKSPDSFRLPRPHDHVTGKPRPSWSAFKIRRPNAAARAYRAKVRGQAERKQARARKKKARVRKKKSSR
jgi:hypothetical protein